MSSFDPWKVQNTWICSCGSSVSSQEPIGLPIDWSYDPNGRPLCGRCSREAPPSAHIRGAWVCESCGSATVGEPGAPLPKGWYVRGSGTLLCPDCAEPAEPAAPPAPGHDPVNHPSHYCLPGGLECLDIIEALGLDYHLGNAFKYLWRAGRKQNTTEDIRKAIFYLQRWVDARA